MGDQKQREELATHDIFDLHAEFCKVFSDPKRLRIMWSLQGGEHSVSDLAEELGFTVSNTSQHLRMMFDRGAVTYRREGKSILYRIANDKFIQGCMKIREGLLEQLQSRNQAASA